MQALWYGWKILMRDSQIFLFKFSRVSMKQRSYRTACERFLERNVRCVIQFFRHFLEKAKDFARIFRYCLSLVILFSFDELLRMLVWQSLAIHSATKMFLRTRKLIICIKLTLSWNRTFHRTATFAVRIQMKPGSFCSMWSTSTMRMEPDEKHFDTVISRISRMIYFKMKISSCEFDNLGVSSEILQAQLLRHALVLWGSSMNWTW
jgi:hypothetical protein